MDNDELSQSVYEDFTNLVEKYSKLELGSYRFSGMFLTCLLIFCYKNAPSKGAVDDLIHKCKKAVKIENRPKL